MIETLGKGALPRPKTKTLPHLFAALSPADFSKGSGLPRPPLKDQNSSDSCVAHAWSYYHWQLKAKDFSCRDLFVRIARTYGAVIGDGANAIVKAGQATTDEVSDPNPETPQNMRDATGVTPSKEASDQELSYTEMSDDIETLASAIVAFKGAVFGVTGSNPGWEERGTLTVPEPPITGEDTWGHALYAVDFHIHQNPDGTTEKCIIAATSWPTAGITEHHVRQRYFAADAVFNSWTLIPKSLTPNSMPQIKSQAFGPERRIVLAAANPDEWTALCAVFGKDPNSVDETVVAQ